MVVLKALLRQAAERIGVLRYEKIQEVRDFVRNMDINIFKKEVDEIDDIELLRLLWGAGLTAEQQEIVLKKTEELMSKK